MSLLARTCKDMSEVAAVGIGKENFLWEITGRRVEYFSSVVEFLSHDNLHSFDLLVLDVRNGENHLRDIVEMLYTQGCTYPVALYTTEQVGTAMLPYSDYLLHEGIPQETARERIEKVIGMNGKNSLSLKYIAEILLLQFFAENGVK